MVRVPSNVVGRVRPTRQALASPTTTATPRAFGLEKQAFGIDTFRQLSGLGNAINQFSVQLQRNRTQESMLDANLRLAQFEVEQDDVLDNMNRNAPAHSSIDAEYESQFETRANELLDSIEDEDTKAAVFDSLTKRYTRNTIKAQQLERNRNEASVNNKLKAQLETSRNIVRTAPTRLDEQVELVFDTLQQAEGIIPRVEAEQKVRDYLAGLNFSAAKGRADVNAELVMSELRSGLSRTPGEAALLYRESGGNPAVVNSQGFAGLYQFGAPRLSDLGVYTAGKGESLKNWQGDWSGKFKVPGFPQVKNLGHFLASPDAQHEAYKLHREKMDQEIRENGFDKFIGKHVQGALISRQSLHNMIHLGGVGGTRKFLSGKGNPADANGTTLRDYAMMGSNSTTSIVGGLDAVLKPEQKEALINYTQSVMDDKVKRQNSLEVEADRDRARRHAENLSEALVEVADESMTEAKARDLLDQRLISPAGYNAIKSAMDEEFQEGSESTALDLEEKILRGEVTEPSQVLEYKATVQPNELSRLMRLTRSVNSVPALNNEQKAQLDYVEKMVGPVRGPFGRMDATAVARGAEAKREYIRRVQAGENAIEVADDLVERLQPRAVRTAPVTPPRSFRGGVDRPAAELRKSLSEAHKKNTADYEAGKMTRPEYERSVLQAVEFKRWMEQEADRRALREEAKRRTEARRGR